MIYFTAHTFKCVCHCRRAMFRVLGMYNFGKKFGKQYGLNQILWDFSFLTDFAYLFSDTQYTSKKFKLPLKFANLLCCVDCHGLKYLLIEYFNWYATMSHTICEITQLNPKIDEMSGKKVKIILKKLFHPIVIHQSLCLLQCLQSNVCCYGSMGSMQCSICVQSIVKKEITHQSFLSSMYFKINISSYHTT